MDSAVLADRLGIADVLTAYTVAIDTGDWDRLDTVFTEDARIDYSESGGQVGRFPEIKAWLADTLPIFVRRQHQLGQMDVQFDGDTATVAAYFINPMVYVADGEERMFECGGVYHHDMVRTPAGWRSRKLHEQLIWRRA